MAKITPIMRQLTSLKTDLVFSAATGDYKGYQKAAIEYAKLAVDHFDEAVKAPSPQMKAPLFSSYGLKMAKVWFMDKFRNKTPAEKAFLKLAKEFKAKKELSDKIRYV